MNKLSHLLVLTTLSLGVSAQYISIPEYNLENQYSVNPAYISSNRNGIVYLAKRDYMYSMENSPTNLDMGALFPVLLNTSCGFKINVNKQGVFQVINPELNYSYQIDFEENNSLHFGLSAGIIKYSMNTNDIVTGDLSDKVLRNDYYNNIKFTAGTGIYYNLKDLGIHLVAPRLFEHDNFRQTVFSMVTYDIHAMRVNNGDVLRFQPAIGYLYLPASPGQMYFNLLTDYKNTLFLHTGYCTNKSITAGLSFNFYNIVAGYIHRFNTGDLANISKNSHEITLSYILDSDVLTKGWDKFLRNIKVGR
jgi:type IX secretion system PorP/SprF family membrane protein